MSKMWHVVVRLSYRQHPMLAGDIDNEDNVVFDVKDNVDNDVRIDNVLTLSTFC